jgi:hypothetical protein
MREGGSDSGGFEDKVEKCPRRLELTQARDDSPAMLELTKGQFFCAGRRTESEKWEAVSIGLW